MADPVADALPAGKEEAPPKKSGDFLKTYVIVMGVLAAVLAYFAWDRHAQKTAFEKANAEAQSVFGGPLLPASEVERPTTIRALAVGILKYLSSVKDMPKGSNEAAIPVQSIRNKANSLGLVIKYMAPEQTTPNRSKGYEEVSTSIQLEAVDLLRLSTFLYNIEADSTKVRILDVRWDLKPDRENPYPPGNMAQMITVKVGFRRPIARGTT